MQWRLVSLIIHQKNELKQENCAKYVRGVLFMTFYETDFAGDLSNT